jgi:hypothetical protein
LKIRRKRNLKKLFFITILLITTNDSVENVQLTCNDIRSVSVNHDLGGRMNTVLYVVRVVWLRDFRLMGLGVVEVCSGICCIFLWQGYGQRKCLGLCVDWYITRGISFLTKDCWSLNSVWIDGLAKLHNCSPYDQIFYTHKL